MNLSELVETAGKLLDVQGFSFSELPHEISAIGLIFDHIQCFICVAENTDEIKLCSEIDIQNFIKSNTAIFFSEFLGKKLQWVWSLQNNQGYTDGLQFQFQNSDTFLELLVEASSIKQYAVKKV